MITVKDITCKLADIKAKGYGVENNMIRYVDVNIIGHFGNIPCLTIACDCICPYGTRNDLASIGFLIQALVEFFEVGEEDGVMLSSLRNIPCRLAFEGNGEYHFGERAIGIGHFMKDKFILFDDFARLGNVKGGAEA